MNNKTSGPGGFIGFVGAAAFAVVWSIIANQVDWFSTNKAYTWPITYMLIAAILGYGITRFIAIRYPVLQMRMQNLIAWLFLHRRWLRRFGKIRVLVVGPEGNDWTNRLLTIVTSCRKLDVTQAWQPDQVPEGTYDVVVLASVTDPWYAPSPREEWERLLQVFVDRGGGLIGIHDTLSVWSCHREYRLDGNMIVHERTVTERLLGLEPRMQFVMGWIDNAADSSVPPGYVRPAFYTAPQRLSVRVSDPYAEPNLWLNDFVIQDEMLPYNVVPEVEPFLTTTVLDVVAYAPAYWHKDFVVSGGMRVNKGRTAFCCLGHEPSTYSSQSFQRHLINLIRWCGAKSKGQSLCR